MPAKETERAPRTVSRSTLLVSGTEKSLGDLKYMLDGSLFRPTASAKNGGEARRLLISGSFDAVIINSPLPDELGVELSLRAAEDGFAVLLCVKSEGFDEICARVEGSGVFTLGKPVSRARFHQALHLLEVSLRRAEIKEREIERLREKLFEARLVGRAKCLLIEYRHFTENEAHKYIEKEAMDRRLSLKAIAQEIIDELEVKR